MARREDTTDLDAVLSEPEDRHTLAESITGRLRQLILDGQLRPGQALRPADLAPRLGVSAMPVREALRILDAEGLVTFKPRIGARVAEIREEDVEELYLIRGALEGLAARLAADESDRLGPGRAPRGVRRDDGGASAERLRYVQPVRQGVPSTPVRRLGSAGSRQADPRPLGCRPPDLRRHAADRSDRSSRPGRRTGRSSRRSMPATERRRAADPDPHRGGRRADPGGPSRTARRRATSRTPRTSCCPSEDACPSSPLADQRPPGPP